MNLSLCEVEITLVILLMVLLATSQIGLGGER